MKLTAIFDRIKLHRMNPLFKLNRETRFIVNIAAIALLLPFVLLCGFLLSYVIRSFA